jgi:hypothetical protein
MVDVLLTYVYFLGSIPRPCEEYKEVGHSRKLPFWKLNILVEACSGVPVGHEGYR